MKSANAVLDASVLVRATVDQATEPQRWVQAVEGSEVTGLAPDLVWVEYANALTGCVRHAMLSASQARQMLEYALQLPLKTRTLSDLALAAFVVAVERGLSAYDACYVALAEAADAVLVTADQRLADAYDRVELVA